MPTETAEGGKEQYHPKCHEKIFEKTFKNPLTTNAERAIINTENKGCDLTADAQRGKKGNKL